MKLPKWLRRKPKSWPRVAGEEIRKRARIVVIDDSDFPYLVLFKRDEYTMEKWDQIRDLPKLESGYFDVILLDIQGVGTQESKEQGLGILRHLKRVAPAQIIVAYSNAAYELKYREFFDLADATLDKQSDYVDFKQTIDKMLEKRFSLNHYVDQIVALAATQASPPDLRRHAEEAILRGDLSELGAHLAGADVDRSVAGLMLQVAQAAISILQLLRVS